MVVQEDHTTKVLLGCLVTRLRRMVLKLHEGSRVCKVDVAAAELRGHGCELLLREDADMLATCRPEVQFRIQRLLMYANCIMVRMKGK